MTEIIPVVLLVIAMLGLVVVPVVILFWRFK